MTVKDLFSMAFQLENGTQVNLDGAEGHSAYYYNEDKHLIKVPFNSIMIESPFNETQITELNGLREEWKRFSKISVNLSWACNPDRNGR